MCAGFARNSPGTVLGPASFMKGQARSIGRWTASPPKWGHTTVGLFNKLRRHGGSVGKDAAASMDRAATNHDFRHLRDFVQSRTGVEAYVEPRTNVTEMTVVLVAADGEWTRRRVAGKDGARELSTKLGIPVYDVQRTGYPQRMRDWSARKKKSGELNN